uniref:Endonuclease/exonuclease/phosphatase domain-containing protein n=1 Tax=Brassica oleracea var. oleracea TaxID=109376 RepID=A0A0D2ZY75_BRAOL
PGKTRKVAKQSKKQGELQIKGGAPGTPTSSDNTPIVNMIPPRGLGLFWKQGLDLQIVAANANVIDTFIQFQGKKFYSSFVLGSTDRNQRNLLWDQMVTKSLIREEAWFVTGDFNDLIGNEEKE